MAGTTQGTTTGRLEDGSVTKRVRKWSVAAVAAAAVAGFAVGGVGSPIESGEASPGCAQGVWIICDPVAGSDSRGDSEADGATELANGDRGIWIITIRPG